MIAPLDGRASLLHAAGRLSPSQAVSCSGSCDPVQNPAGQYNPRNGPYTKDIKGKSLIETVYLPTNHPKGLWPGLKPQGTALRSRGLCHTRDGMSGDTCPASGSWSWILQANSTFAADACPWWTFDAPVAGVSSAQRPVQNCLGDVDG